MVLQRLPFLVISQPWQRLLCYLLHSSTLLKVYNPPPRGLMDMSMLILEDIIQIDIQKFISVDTKEEMLHDEYWSHSLMIFIYV